MEKQIFMKKYLRIENSSAWKDLSFIMQQGEVHPPEEKYLDGIVYNICKHIDLAGKDLDPLLREALLSMLSNEIFYFEFFNRSFIYLKFNLVLF